MFFLNPSHDDDCWWLLVGKSNECVSLFIFFWSPHTACRLRNPHTWLVSFLCKLVLHVIVWCDDAVSLYVTLTIVSFFFWKLGSLFLLPRCDEEDDGNNFDYLNTYIWEEKEYIRTHSYHTAILMNIFSPFSPCSLSYTSWLWLLAHHDISWIFFFKFKCARWCWTVMIMRICLHLVL